MPQFTSDRIGLETGTYQLPCGCKIYIYFPGGTIHFDSGWVTTKCQELHRLWREYERAVSSGGADPHSWESLTKYIECLRHVGVWEGRIKTIEKLRSHYPNPAEDQDYPTAPTELEEPHVIAAT